MRGDWCPCLALSSARRKNWEMRFPGKLGLIRIISSQQCTPRIWKCNGGGSLWMLEPGWDRSLVSPMDHHMLFLATWKAILDYPKALYFVAIVSLNFRMNTPKKVKPSHEMTGNWLWDGWVNSVPEKGEKLPGAEYSPRGKYWHLIKMTGRFKNNRKIQEMAPSSPF